MEMTDCISIVISFDGRSASYELNLSKFLNFRRLENLQLRSVSGLTMSQGSSRLSHVGRLVHLNTLVSVFCCIVFRY